MRPGARVRPYVLVHLVRGGKSRPKCPSGKHPKKDTKKHWFALFGGGLTPSPHTILRFDRNHISTGCGTLTSNPCLQSSDTLASLFDRFWSHIFYSFIPLADWTMNPHSFILLACAHDYVVPISFSRQIEKFPRLVELLLF